MSYQDYLDKNTNYKEFISTYKISNITRNSFDIKIELEGSYKEYVNLINDMTTNIGRLKEIGWNLFDIKIYSEQSTNGVDEVTISDVFFYFSKTDVKDITLPGKLSGMSTSDLNKKIKGLLDKIGLDITNITINDYDDDYYDEGDYTYKIDIDFQTNEFDGRIPRDIEDRFNKVCKVIDASYNYVYGDYKMELYI